MNIEWKLAKIEVIVEDLNSRADKKYAHCNLQASLEGIKCEASTLHESYKNAKKSIRHKEIINANRNVGDFAIASKNLADNLNRFLQTVYSPSCDCEIDLRELEENTKNAPLTSTKKKLSCIFNNVHNNSKNNPLMVVRNMKSHGEGHLVLRDKTKSSGKYCLDFNGNLEDPINWLDKNFNEYVDMVTTCLETISDYDSANFSKNSKRKSITYQRIKNFAKRHKNPVLAIAATALLSAGVAGGIGGTLAWQNYQEKQLVEKQLNRALYIFQINSKIRKSYDYHEFIAADNFEREIITKMIKDQAKYLGIETLNKSNPFVQEYLDSLKHSKKN